MSEHHFIHVHEPQAMSVPAIGYYHSVAPVPPVTIDHTQDLVDWLVSHDGELAWLQDAFGVTHEFVTEKHGQLLAAHQETSDSLKTLDLTHDKTMARVATLESWRSTVSWAQDMEEVRELKNAAFSLKAEVRGQAAASRAYVDEELEKVRATHAIHGKAIETLNKMHADARGADLDTAASVARRFADIQAEQSHILPYCAIIALTVAQAVVAYFTFFK